MQSHCLDPKLLCVLTSRKAFPPFFDPFDIDVPGRSESQNAPELLVIVSFERTSSQRLSLPDRRA